MVRVRLQDIESVLYNDLLPSIVYSFRKQQAAHKTMIPYVSNCSENTCEYADKDFSKQIFPLTSCSYSKIFFCSVFSVSHAPN